MRSSFVAISGEFFLLENYVAVLDGVEDLAAELALDKLRVLVARDDADLWVFAGHGDGLQGRNGKIFTRFRAAVNEVLMNFPLSPTKGDLFVMKLKLRLPQDRQKASWCCVKKTLAVHYI
jgi:hypothetical protein